MKEKKGSPYKVAFYTCRRLVKGANGQLCIPSQNSPNFKKVISYHVDVHKVAMGNGNCAFHDTVLNKEKGVFFTKIFEVAVRLTREEEVKIIIPQPAKKQLKCFLVMEESEIV